jgi:hypothetical protein
MYTFQLTILGLALVSVQYTLAFVNIIIPSIIAAGQDTQIQIINDLSTGTYSDNSHFRNFKVYLFIPIPGWDLGTFGYYPTCLLTDELSINVTAATVRIPASAGPNASNYRFTLEEYRCDGAYCDSNTQESIYFKLIGGTGECSQAELAGHNIGPDFHGLSCSAYDCERKCNHKYISGNWSSAFSYEATKKCVKQCSGATFRGPDGKPFNYTGPSGSQNPFRNTTLSPILGISTQTTMTAISSSSSFTNATAKPFAIQNSSVLTSSTLSSSPAAYISSTTTKASPATTSSIVLQCWLELTT